MKQYLIKHRISKWLFVLCLFSAFSNTIYAQQTSPGKYVIEKFLNYKCPETDNGPRPFGMAFNGKNQLFMLCGDNSGNNYVFEVEKDGSYTEIARMKTNFSGPGIAIDNKNNILVATGEKLFRINQEGHLEILFSDFHKAGDIKIDNKGNMYVIDFGKYIIYKITPDLERTIWIDRFEGKILEFKTGGIEFDPSFENLLVCDYSGHKITKYPVNSDGTAGEAIQLIEKQSLFWAAYGSNNSIFFTDWAGSKIIKLNNDSSIETIAFGNVPIGIIAGKGSFGKDTMYVSDNYGIKKLYWIKSTGVDEKNSIMNGLNIFPNPATNNLNINLMLSEPSEVKIKVCDLHGKIITEVANDKYLMGNQSFTWNTCYENLEKVPGGIYICQVEATNKNNSVKNKCKVLVIR